MKKILLVDDEESILLLISEEIEEELVGVIVDMAHNGEECLRKFEAANYDLIILDINMPGMNGIEVLIEIKKVNYKFPVIISSAYPEYKDKEELGILVFDDYIVKSANTEELVNSITKLLKD